MGVRLIAGGWGFAEATLFFIVPDVFLSRLGIDNLRHALWACGVALGGAVIGGLLIASGIASLLRRVVVRRVLVWLWGLLWLGFYIWYFAIVVA